MRHTKWHPADAPLSEKQKPAGVNAGGPNCNAGPRYTLFGAILNGCSFGSGTAFILTWATWATDGTAQEFWLLSTWSAELATSAFA